MPGLFALCLSVGIHVLVVVLLIVSAPKDQTPSDIANSEIETTVVLSPTKLVTSQLATNESSEVAAPGDTDDSRHVEYAGSPKAAHSAEVNSDDNAPQEPKENSPAFEELETPASEPQGQISDRVDPEGLQAPRLTIQGLTPSIIDTLLERGQARLIAVTDENTQYQLQGSLSQPAGFRRVSDADLEQLSQRSVTLSSSMTAPCRNRLVSDWGLSRESALKATIGIWFTNSFDNYLLSVQLKAVAHLPPAERSRQKTILMLKQSPTGVQAVAIPSGSAK